jgi:hypothetical protein
MRRFVSTYTYVRSTDIEKLEGKLFAVRAKQVNHSSVRMTVHVARMNEIIRLSFSSLLDISVFTAYC